MIHTSLAVLIYFGQKNFFQLCQAWSLYSWLHYQALGQVFLRIHASWVEWLILFGDFILISIHKTEMKA